MPQAARFSADLSCDVLLWEFCLWGLDSLDKLLGGPSQKVRWEMATLN